MLLVDQSLHGPVSPNIALDNIFVNGVVEDLLTISHEVVETWEDEASSVNQIQIVKHSKFKKKGGENHNKDMDPIVVKTRSNKKGDMFGTSLSKDSKKGDTM